MPEPTPCNLRRAEPGDAGAAAEVLLRSRHASVPAIPPVVHTDEDAKTWFAQTAMKTNDVWVAEIDSAIVGVMVLNGNWVTQLYVDPEWTGRGVGSEMIDMAKTTRPELLDLWTFQSNLGAQRFYERHGFTEVGRTLGDNEEGAPDIHYRWVNP